MKNKYLLLLTLFLMGIQSDAQIQHLLNQSPLKQTPEIDLSSEQFTHPVFDSALRARPFQLNPELTDTSALIVGHKIDMPLFENKQVSGIIKSKTTDINKVTTLVIQLDDFKYAYAYLSISKNSYVLRVDIPERNEFYTTKSPRPLKNAYLIEIDSNEKETLNCGLHEEGSLHKANTSKSASSSKQLIDPSETCLTLPTDTDVANIDILIVYTDAAETWATNNDGSINNTIAMAITQANQISTNNGLGINFTAVHTAKVSYTEVSAGADLEALRNSTDGAMDEIHDLRRTHNADLVSVFTYLTGDGIGGIANLLTTRYGHPGKAFSNVKVNNANSIYTFAHEIGHTMGANHYRSQSEAPGPTEWIDWPANDWSSGWRDQNGSDFRTIMTYSDGLPDPVIPYLSDPTLNFAGDPIGDAVQADNARTLREVKHEVSRYSEAVQYCLTGVTIPNAFYISSVAMGDINHSSTESFYSDLSGLGTCMDPGDTQTLTVDIANSGGTSYVSVWIDWDDDDTFASSERVFQSVPGLAQYTVDITSPLGISAGQKRMRIRTYDTGSGGSSDPCGYFTFGEVEDYTILLGEGDPCSNASIPQNLNVAENNGTEAKIAWDPYSGVDYYELDYRELGTVGWTSVSNIVYPFYTLTNLEVRTDYEVRVRSVCTSSPTAFSSILQFTSADYNYCESSANSAADSYIARIQLNTIDNTTTNANGGYSDFTNISTNLDQNTGHTLTITPGWPGTNYSLGYGVWIDFNYDGDFDDQFEELLLTPGITSSSPINVNFTVPYGVVPGPTRLRIVARQGNIASACGLYSNGETEDYTVNLGNGLNCTTADVPSGLDFNDPVLSWNLVSGALYDIRYRPTGTTTWVEITDHLYNSVVLENLVFQTEYEAQVRSKCPEGTPSGYSGSFVFTIDYCGAGADNTSSEKIANVSFVNIDNSSSSTTGYEDFTGISTSVSLDATYPIEVTIDENFFTNDEIFVWIDFNQDGDFTDPDEKVVDSRGLTNALVSANITIPSDALTGETRMRIRLQYPSAESNRTPCGNSFYGEVEDYTVNIIPALSTPENMLATLRVYPNPFGNNISVNYDNMGLTRVQARIVDISGKTVRTQRFTDPVEKLTLFNLATLKSGLYFLEITDLNTMNKTIRKIIKK
ncbi:GEVED domain-containing protein [Aestuariivivens sediminicola]|uniref:GEVED domain-containing protein n=1 Tax=Aestuariivivens sediminicola TaxID=2913560 RepID=UPI001F58F7DD|nr:GEVED domain-containing protein [Aestuariivivens sediminicola]